MRAGRDDINNFAVDFAPHFGMAVRDDSPDKHITQPPKVGPMEEQGCIADRDEMRTATPAHGAPDRPNMGHLAIALS